MKNKLRYFMVLTALAMCFGTFSVTAYAQSNEPQEETAPVEETTEPEETATPNPFTPNGTGTVLDNATSEDEKEFYTIVTENENVFYLVIDKQRDTENVYFLNAVTESDLMALAEPDAEETAEPVESEPEPTPSPEPEEPAEGIVEPEPEPVPETGTSPIMLVLIGVAVLAVGGLGYYFKKDYCKGLIRPVENGLKPVAPVSDRSLNGFACHCFAPAPQCDRESLPQLQSESRL